MTDRTKGIGGTDIAAIMGVHPYRTAHDVFLEKTGRSVPVPMNEPMYWGIHLEVKVADRYQKEHPDIEVVRDLGVIPHPEHPWWLGSPDASAYKNGETVWGIEVKTASSFRKKSFGEPGTDQIPKEYILQCMWYMPVLGVNEMHVPVLFGGQEYQEYMVKKDNDLLDMMFESAREFWMDNVQKDVPPPMDGSEACKDLMLSKYPDANDKIINAEPMLVDFAARYNDIRTSMKDLKEEQEKLKNIFKKELGENKGMECDQFRLTWNNHNRKAATDWESVQGHFVRTLEKGGLEIQEAQELVARIVKQSTAQKPYRSFNLTWREKEK